MDTLETLKKKLSETPEEGASPVSNLEVHSNAVVDVTVRELLAACEANPDHEVAKVYKKAARRFRLPNNKPDLDAPLHVDKVDLQALLDNKEVEIESSTATDEEGDPVVVKTKKLGKSCSSKVSPASTPTTTTPPPKAKSSPAPTT